MKTLPPVGQVATTLAERAALLDEFSDEVCFELFIGARRLTGAREAELNYLMRYDLPAARRLLKCEALRLESTRP